jgi:hypothetical protein
MASANMTDISFMARELFNLAARGLASETYGMIGVALIPVSAELRKLLGYPGAE